MRIGVMLRHLDQHGVGALVYTQNLLGRLLAMDTANEYVLVYRNAKWIGTYGDGERIREVAAPAPSALIWDQLWLAKNLLVRLKKEIRTNIYIK